MNKNLKFDQLSSIPVPVQTATYIPVPYTTMATLIRNSVENNNMSIFKESYNITKNGKQLISTITIKGKHPELNMMISYLNNYDKSRSIIIGIGSSVCICTNGMIIADFIFKHKHTGDVTRELVLFIKYAIQTMQQQHNKTITLMDTLKGITVSKRIQAELAGRLFIEYEIITATQLNIVKRQIEKPTFNYHNNNSIWDFYNHVTLSLKTTPPSKFIDRHMKFSNFITEEFLVK